MSSPAEVKSLSLESGRTLSPEVRDRLLTMGVEAAQPLIDVLEDRELWKASAPGEGYAPVHAAAILGELHPPQALGSLLRALADVDPLDPLTSTLIDALTGFGEDLAEPALEAIAGGESTEYHLSLSYSLAKCGVEDERIYEHLLAMLERKPEAGPQLLADYQRRSSHREVW